MSMVVEDDAVVLRSIRFGDTSRIVVFLTGRFGKIHAVAKGARLPKSGFGAALVVLAESRIVFYLKRERELQLVKKADLIDAHDALLLDAVRYHYGCAAVEFADRLMYGEGDSAGPVDLLRQALALFEGVPGDRMPAVFKAYQLRFAAMLGYRPHLSGCTQCLPGEEARSLRFGVRAGGPVCPRHQAGSGEMVSMSPETVEVLRTLTESESVSDLGRWPASHDAVVERVVEGFLRYHIDGYRGLRSLKSLRDLEALRAPRRAPRRVVGESGT